MSEYTGPEIVPMPVGSSPCGYLANKRVDHYPCEMDEHEEEEKE